MEHGLPRRQLSALHAEVVVEAAAAATRPESIERVEKCMMSSWRLKSYDWAREVTTTGKKSGLQILEGQRRYPLFIWIQSHIPLRLLAPRKTAPGNGEREARLAGRTLGSVMSTRQQETVIVRPMGCQDGEREA